MFTFLQIDLANPAPITADSLRNLQHELIQQVAADPHAFWDSFIKDAIQFGLKVLAALAIYLVGAWLIKRVKVLLDKIFTRRNTEQTLATFVTSFLSIMLTIILVIISVSTLGVDTTSLAALLAAGGMAIGMALSGTVQNFAGGIMLLVFKPFKAGDFIDAQGVKGTVQEVSIVATSLLTVDNRIVVLPNGALANGNIDNYSAKPYRRVDIEVSVAYGTDADKCIATLNELIRQEPFAIADGCARNAQGEPVPMGKDANPDYEPFVALLALNANDITFVTRTWTDANHYWDVFFGLKKRFYNELPKQGYKFAYPHCDVTILNK